MREPEGVYHEVVVHGFRRPCSQRMLAAYIVAPDAHIPAAELLSEGHQPEEDNEQFQADDLVIGSVAESGQHFAGDAAICP